MTRHGSASTRKHESHLNSGNLINHLIELASEAVRSPFDPATAARQYDLKGIPRKSDDLTPNLKRRARRLAVDGQVDHGTRRLIRYALDNRDPYLVQLVTRVEHGEMKIEHLILEED